MSTIANKELVKHILEETTFILDHTNGISKEVYLNDAVLCRATIRSLEIIGEASKKLSDNFKKEHPNIEWRKIAGTRDKLIHDYYGIDYEILWDVFTQKIQPLHAYLANLE
ncbi:MAG: DUF86 domain-containing protein [Bacteroidota bacterium]